MRSVEEIKARIADLKRVSVLPWIEEKDREAARAAYLVLEWAWTQPSLPDQSLEYRLNRAIYLLRETHKLWIGDEDDELYQAVGFFLRRPDDRGGIVQTMRADGRRSDNPL